MSNSRRNFIRNSAMLSGLLTMKIPFEAVASLKVADPLDKLVLLGTQGGPFIRSYKQTPSANLILYKGSTFVVDAGYGVSLKLRDAGVNLANINYIFITHHHSDHNLELGPLLYNAWIAGLSKPIHVYGPSGTEKMLYHYWESNRADIDMRIPNESRPDIRKLIITHEISEGKVLELPGVEILALKNIHPPVENSFSFKFILGDKSIVFSGDTTYCPSLIEFATGTDWLIHEVMDVNAVEEMAKRRPNAPKLKESILAHHTTKEDVGKIAEAAKAKNLILNHFVPPDDKTLTDEFWTEAVRKNYSGKIFIGKDLMEFPI